MITQEKIFLTPDEITWGWKGGNELKVIHAPWGKLVILICYDIQFAAISAKLSKYNLDLILVPSMTDQHGRRRVQWASQARMIEHRAYVIITGTVQSSTTNPDHWGKALFYSPQAGYDLRDDLFPLTPSMRIHSRIIKEGKLNEPSLVSAQLNISELKESKKINIPFSARDQDKKR